MSATEFLAAAEAAGVPLDRAYQAFERLKVVRRMTPGKKRERAALAVGLWMTEAIPQEKRVLKVAS